MVHASAQCIFGSWAHEKACVFKATDPKVRNRCFWACFLMPIVTKCNWVGILNGGIHSKSLRDNSGAIERGTKLTLCLFMKNIWGSCRGSCGPNIML